MNLDETLEALEEVRGVLHPDDFVALQALVTIRARRLAEEPVLQPRQPGWVERERAMSDALEEYAAGRLETPRRRS